MRMTEREHSRLWALHQPWPRELPASSQQSGAKKAAAAQLEALGPTATGHIHEAPSPGTERIDKPEVAAPEGERERGTMPPQSPSEGVLATLHGTFPGDLEGDMPLDPGGEENVEHEVDPFSSLSMARRLHRLRRGRTTRTTRNNLKRPSVSVTLVSRAVTHMLRNFFFFFLNSSLLSTVHRSSGLRPNDKVCDKQSRDYALKGERGMVDPEHIGKIDSPLGINRIDHGSRLQVSLKPRLG